MNARLFMADGSLAHNHVSRRAVARRLGGGLLAGLLVARSPMKVLAQEATPAAESAIVGATFVGKTSDPNTFVAVVLGGTPDDNVRPARGYLCNGLWQTVDVWLEGEAASGQIALTAADGSWLTATINAAGVGGGATLADGSSLVFAAVPAQGIAGLYSVAVLADGSLQGVSAEDGRFAGELLGDATPTGSGFAYAVTVTTAAGAVFAVPLRTATAEEGGFPPHSPRRRRRPRPGHDEGRLQEDQPHPGAAQAAGGPGVSRESGVGSRESGVRSWWRGWLGVRRFSVISRSAWLTAADPERPRTPRHRPDGR